MSHRINKVIIIVYLFTCLLVYIDGRLQPSGLFRTHSARPLPSGMVP